MKYYVVLEAENPEITTKYTAAYFRELASEKTDAKAKNQKLKMIKDIPDAISVAKAKSKENHSALVIFEVTAHGHKVQSRQGRKGYLSANHVKFVKAIAIMKKPLIDSLKNFDIIFWLAVLAMASIGYVFHIPCLLEGSVMFTFFTLTPEAFKSFSAFLERRRAAALSENSDGEEQILTTELKGKKVAKNTVMNAAHTEQAQPEAPQLKRSSRIKALTQAALDVSA